MSSDQPMSAKVLIDSDDADVMSIDTWDVTSKYYVILPSSVYSGVLEHFIFPTYFVPVYKAIDSNISDIFGIPKEIGIIIAAYFYDLQFTCDDDVVQYVVDHCSHDHPFCKKNMNHFGNCMVCTERYGLDIQCDKCNEPDCHIECLQCVDCNYTHCDECGDWHCNKAVLRCSICNLYKHWINVQLCEGRDGQCLSTVCVSCNDCTDGRVLCYWCNDYFMLR